MGSGPGNWASGEAHQLTEGAGDLPERVLHGGDIAGQHHRAGEAIEKTDLHRAGLGGDVAGDNRCFTGGNGKNADGGDRVRQTQLLNRSLPGLAMRCARVTCLPGTYSWIMRSVGVCGSIIPPSAVATAHRAVAGSLPGEPVILSRLRCRWPP